MIFIVGNKLEFLNVDTPSQTDLKQIKKYRIQHSEKMQPDNHPKSGNAGIGF